MSIDKEKKEGIMYDISLWNPQPIPSCFHFDDDIARDKEEKDHSTFFITTVGDLSDAIWSFLELAHFLLWLLYYYGIIV